VKILGIHHISIATNNIAAHREILRQLFDVDSESIESNPASKVALSFMDFGNTKIELIEPLDNDSAISNFLEKRGPGIHHICIQVENLDRALDELRLKNVRLIDQKPRIGAGGARIAFIHPESAGGILIELEEHS
jgi:methylmalonyl-CoA epimerase